MQCLNCGFENVPGIRSCVRCQSLLELDTVGVRPPRRGDGLLAGLAWRRQEFDWRFQHVLLSVSRPAGLAMLGLVPGLLQFRFGQRLFGWCLLSGWIVAILLAVAFCGQGLGQLGLGLLPAIHAASIVSAIAQREQITEIGPRLLLGVATTVGIYVLIYMPIRSVVAAFVQPVQIRNLHGVTAVVHDDDVLLCTGWRSSVRDFSIGDIVIYRINGGYGIDRILGTGNDELEIKDHKLFINGKEPPQDRGPLGQVPWPTQAPTIAGTGVYLIVPSLLEFYAGHMEGDAIQRYLNGFTCIRADDIVGKPFWRVSPRSRWGPVR